MTEFLDAIIVSLQIHIQIVACFSSYRSEICLISHSHPSTIIILILPRKTISFSNSSLLIFWVQNRLAT